MMIEILIGFFTSFLTTFLIVKTKAIHEKYSGDGHLDSPQRIHSSLTPRVGGIAIFLGFSVAIFASAFNLMETKTTNLTLLICSIPVFSIGLLEDMTKRISIKMRFLFIAFGAFLAIYFLDIRIHEVNIVGLDIFLAYPAVSILFTAFAITGLSNAYNIIDGLNGLSSMVSTISLFALSLISLAVGDDQLFQVCALIIAITIGFMPWNYPKGLIFLGDGGAYLLGFLIATISILLVNRHTEISPWAIILINSYPIIETLFTIYRRKFHQGKNPSLPDCLHMHSLVYKRIFSHQSLFTKPFSNARASAFIWLISLVYVIPAVLWWDSTQLLFISFILVVIL
jgi:UDP-N-acetylmuramyl pentapeptide phosphotransferase/UDP-N-acetylglucosamine-1-phosphate transferase